MVASVAGRGREVESTLLRRNRRGGRRGFVRAVPAGGAPEPNVTLTIERIKHEIYEKPHQIG